MTLVDTAKATIQAADLKSLELLFEYTKFHIGVYLTLASSFIAIASLRKGETFLFTLCRPFVWAAMFFFMIAGLAGGVIVSTITQCYGIDLSGPFVRCSSTLELLKMEIGPWNWKSIRLRGETWTYVEHTSFWLGVISAVLSFAFQPKSGRTHARDAV